ncbi:hypothetical protein [Embleya sp. NPDC020886]|uniref:hypothetical protein n=1 Tax=Embleya sp. NPDC020886 TaxID=3363980 RepID=UPI0037A1F120
MNEFHEFLRDDEGSPLEFALQWSTLPAEHLQIALTALEPELARRNERRKLAAELAAREAEAIREHARMEAESARAHSLYMSGLWAGAVLVLVMLGGSIFVGTNGQPWLSAMLAGPSMLALAGLFVLRRSDRSQSREVARSTSAALASATAPAPAPAGVPASPGGAAPVV